jgi:hypothetical protein
MRCKVPSSSPVALLAWRLARAVPRTTASITSVTMRVLLIGFLAASPAMAAMKPLAKFTKGKMEGKHGGKPFSFVLTRGALSEADAGGHKSNYLDLGFSSSSKTAPGGASIVLIYSSGQTRDLTPVNFGASTKEGGSSRFVAGKATCTFTLSKSGPDGIEGAGTCTGEMWDILKNHAMPLVSDVTFSASP